LRGDPRVVRGKTAGVNDPEAELTYGLFDQVVFSTGRLRGGATAKAKKLDDKLAAGSALAMVDTLKGELKAVKADDYAFPLGMQTEDQRVRLLGACGINSPLFLLTPDVGKLDEYEASLPVQARVVGEGVTLSAVTIAIANRYFKRGDWNTNVNTATLPELQAASAAGDLVFRMRHWRVTPLVDAREAYRATDYWNMYLEDLEKGREDLEKGREILDKSRVEGGKTYPNILGYLNNAAELLDDPGWKKTKEFPETWKPLGHDVGAFANLTRRYAAYIATIGGAKTELEK
jgi:hypothetical protein